MAPRIIPPDDSKSVSEKRIAADRAAVKAWLAENKPVTIDADGRWERDGAFIKQRKVNSQMPNPFEKWGSK